MTIRTITDVLTSPLGTARLLEGFSTLNRANKAGLRPAQMRAVFTDLADCSDDQITGFVQIGGMLVRGEARFSGKALQPQGQNISSPPPY